MPQAVVPATVRVALLLLLALAGCDRTDVGTARGDSTLTVLQWGDEWVMSAFNWDLSPKFLVFLPLTARNERGELEGRLARSWEHTPDFKAWTIHLRSDVKWHDGVPDRLPESLRGGAHRFLGAHTR